MFTPQSWVAGLQISSTITSLVKDHRSVKNFAGRNDRWTGYGDEAENTGIVPIKFCWSDFQCCGVGCKLDPY